MRTPRIRLSIAPLLLLPLVVLTSVLTSTVTLPGALGVARVARVALSESASADS